MTENDEEKYCRAVAGIREFVYFACYQKQYNSLIFMKHIGENNFTKAATKH